MPQAFGTQFGRREVRAADSAAAGHVQTVGDLDYYNWIANLPGSPAPHHVLGLALRRKLTQGMTPSQIQSVEMLLNQAGLGMGDKGYNLEGLGQAPGTRGKNTLTGEHYEVHVTEDDLIKRLGFRFKKNGDVYIGDTKWTDVDFDTRRDLILSTGMQIEANKEDVQRRWSEKFRNDPNYQQNIDKIRSDYKDYPEAPGPNPERTIGSARTSTNPEFLESLDPNTAEVMVEANRRQLTTPYTGRQHVPENDSQVNPVVNEIITPKPKPTPSVTPSPTPTPTPEPVNPFRNRLMGPNRRGWSQPYTENNRRTKLRVPKDRTGGTDLGAFDGLGHDPTEYIPRGRVNYADDGGVDAGLPMMPLIPGV